MRDRTGIDFAKYKRPTILRRLQRRMAATGARDLREYRAHLEAHPEECERLNEILLHVPLGIVAVNADYDVQHINNAARQFLGVRGSAIGEDLIHAAPAIPSAR